MANNPSLILADEPTATLNAPLGRPVMEFFVEMIQQHQAGVIVVTHDQRTLDVFDRILDVEYGMVEICSEPQPIKS